jgi:hypothetical protein
LEGELTRLQSSTGSRDEWNAVWLHSEWAARMGERYEKEGAWSHVESTVSAHLLGPVLVIALPCEPFCEIGLAIKAAFDRPVIVVGYSNDMIGYIASAEEYPYGGYEPWTAPRHFDQPCPYSPEAASILTEAGIEAGRRALDIAAPIGRTAR